MILAPFWDYLTSESTRTLQRSLVFGVLLFGAALVGGCTDDSVLDDPTALTQIGSRLLIVSNTSLDFQTATYGVLDRDTLLALPDLGALHGDSVVRASRGYVFGINRLGGDNLQRIDPVSFQTVWQYSVEPGANPQDVVVLADGRAYVTRYDRSDIWIVDPDATREADFLLGVIDLSALADTDGLPELGEMVEVGDRVYLTAQRLDRDAGFIPTEASFLLAIDTTVDSPVDLSPDDASTLALELPIVNPIAIRHVGDQLWLACAGSWGVADGAIVPFAINTLEFLDPTVTEAQLGGDLAAFTGSRPTVVLWTDTAFEGHVGVFDVETGDELVRLVDGFSFVQDVEADDDFVYLPDRDPVEPGIRIFRRSDWVEVTEAPIPTGLPPWSLELLDIE